MKIDLRYLKTCMGTLLEELPTSNSDLHFKCIKGVKITFIASKLKETLGKNTQNRIRDNSGLVQS